MNNGIVIGEKVKSTTQALSDALITSTEQ